ncbi:MAG: hypothetical protein K2N31_01830 [Treponemataceae bacterium]|nr:hypothetical protein [Treponemataceae bacterium]
MMKKLSKIALLAAASVFMLAVFPACGDDDGDDDPSVKITGGTSVTVGGTALELTATVSNFPDGVTYEWASSDEGIVTVEKKSDDPSKATVTPVAEGTATITVTATAGDTTATTAIEVSVKAEGSVEEEGKEDGTKGVDAVWDFNAESLQAVGLSTTTTKNPKTDPITPKSGSGATLKFTSTSLGKSVKIQNETTGGLNIGSGSNESDMLLITVDEACTLSFTGKGGVI